MNGLQHSGPPGRLSYNEAGCSRITPILRNGDAFLPQNRNVGPPSGRISFTPVTFLLAAQIPSWH